MKRRTEQYSKPIIVIYHDFPAYLKSTITFPFYT